MEVEHWMGKGAQAYRTQPNSECHHYKNTGVGLRMMRSVVERERAQTVG